MNEITIESTNKNPLLSKSTPIEIVFLPSEQPIETIENNTLEQENNNLSKLDGNFSSNESSQETIQIEQTQIQNKPKRLVRSKSFVSFEKGQTYTESNSNETIEKQNNNKKQIPMKTTFVSPLNPLSIQNASKRSKSANNSPKGRIKINYIRRASSNYPATLFGSLHHSQC